MYFQIEQVLEKQEVKIEKVYKGRGILICEAAEGCFALKEFFGQQQKAEYLYRLGVFLKEHDISCDYILKNQDGNLITEGVDGVKYTFHRWVRGKECDVKNRNDVVDAIAFIGSVHEKIQEMQDETYVAEDIIEEYQRHHRELIRIRKFIQNRNDKSDFERMYLKCIPEYLSQSEYIIKILKNDAFVGQEHTTGICHNDLSQHNIIFDGKERSLIHLERAQRGPLISDVSHFLRKILEKYDWNEALGLEMLREYCRIHPLNETDWKELYCRLSYPEKFWKIANRYYTSRKVWDSGRNYDKLKKEIQQTESRKHFLEILRKVRL